jgi:uncharacterized protein (DUF488 family)
MGLCLLTVGHSNHSVEKLLRILRANRVDVLVDVRSQPYSKYAPHFDKEALKAAVTSAGIGYLFLGDEIGGRPEGAEFYDAEGHVLYDVWRQSPQFLRGIARLEQEAALGRVAILCGEENPAECHRRFLIGRALIERGGTVQHIRGDGRLQSEAELSFDELRGRDQGQLMLFSPEEMAQCKSSPSVSRKKRPPNSSGR